MIINFAFENYRSFLNETILRMEAVKGIELPESIDSTPFGNLLPVAAIFGANSSGKSNTLKALKQMRDIVLNSDKLNPFENLEWNPYWLRLGAEEDPTSFEIQFVLNGFRYRYGFEYSEKGISAEWLYERRPHKKEYLVFEREEGKCLISKTRFKEGFGKEKFTRSNRLFLSLVAQLNGKLSQSILKWFSRIMYISENEDPQKDGGTLKMIYNNVVGCEEVQNLFSKLDLGFDKIEIHKCEEENRLYANTIHNIKDSEDNIKERKSFSLDEMESAGVKKMIELAGPIINTLLQGKILIIDDLDSKLHPFVALKIVRLFMDKKVNKNGAQLIFSTHETNLLDLKFLRRDQIWFTEKNQRGSSILYSLVEFKLPGKKKGKDKQYDFQKDYMNGRFGAIPVFK